MSIEMKQMRIVGLSPSISKIWVQKLNGKEWKQEIMNENEFIEMMKNEFPLHWGDYLNSDCTKNVMDFYYNYGQEGQEEIFVFVE